MPEETLMTLEKQRDFNDLRSRVIMGAENPEDFDLFNQIQRVSPEIVSPLTSEEQIRRGYEIALRAAGLGVQGFNKGLARMLGVPGDVIQEILAALGVEDPERYAGGSDTYNELFKSSFGLTEGFEIEPQSPTQRGIERTGEVVGESMIPSGAALGKGQQLAQQAPQLPKPGLVLNAVRDFLKKLANQPVGKTSAAELGITTIAGGTGAVAQEALPNLPGAEAAGQVVGSVGGQGAIKTVRGVGEVTKFIFRKVVPDSIQRLLPTKANLEFGLRETITPDASIPVAENEAAARSIAGQIPRFQPTAAQASQSDRIISAENIHRTNEGGNRPFQERLTEQNTALRDHAEGIVPDGDISRSQQSLLSRLSKKEQKLQDVIETYEALPDSFAMANRQRQILIQTEKAFERESKIKYDKVENAVDIPLLAGGIRAAALKEMPKGQGGSRPNIEDPDQIPDVIRAILRQFTGRFIPLSEVRALRKRLLNLERRLSIETGSEVASGKVSRLIDAVEVALKEAETSVILLARHPNVMKDFRAANEYFRPRVKVLRSKPISRILARQKGQAGTDMFAIPDNKVMQEILKDAAGLEFYLNAVRSSRQPNIGILKEADTVPRNIFEDQELEDMIMFGIRKEFADSAINPDGTVNPRAAQRFLQTYKSALARVPQIKQEIDVLLTLQKNANIFKFNTPKRTPFSEKQFEDIIGDPPEFFVAEILKNPAKAEAKLRAVVTRLGITRNSPGMLGLRSGFWKHILKISNLKSRNSQGQLTRDLQGELFLDPDKLVQLRQDYGSLFRQLYTPQQLDKIDTLIAGAKLTLTTSFSGPLLKELGPEELYTISNIISRAYGVTRGVIGKSYVAGEFLVKQTNKILGAMSKQKVQKLMNDALLDPDIADTLIGIGRRAERVTKARIRAHFLDLGFEAVEDYKGEDRHLVDKFRKRFSESSTKSVSTEEAVGRRSDPFGAALVR